jgi:thioredoxin reductase (NADPH)
MTPPQVDCLIVGAGPAGLTAAIFLLRFRRSIAVFDGGGSRASFIPISHNYSGFPYGVSGDELLCRLRDQATRYGAVINQSKIDALRQEMDGGFVASAGPIQIKARTVLLATGVVDRKPEMDNLEEAIRLGFVRLCPICDGYDVMDRRIAVLGPLDLAPKHALFLRTYTRDVTVLKSDLTSVLGPEDRKCLGAAGITVIEAPIAGLTMVGDGIAVKTEGGDSRTFEVVYPVMGCEPGSQLGQMLLSEPIAPGDLHVDAHQRTALPGLYAAGDLVSGLNQISVATGQAAIAAADIHNHLGVHYR